MLHAPGPGTLEPPVSDGQKLDLLLVLRVPTTSRTDAVLAEFGRLPLHVMWHQQILKYLNRIAFLPDHHPVHLAFQVSQKLGKNSWYKRLFTRMKEYNLRMRPLPLEVGAATDTMIDAYFAGLGIKKGEREQTRVWQTYVSTRSPVVIESYKPQRYLVDVRNFHARRMLSRFRLGVTELEINMGTHRERERALKSREPVELCWLLDYVYTTSLKADMLIYVP